MKRRIAMWLAVLLALCLPGAALSEEIVADAIADVTLDVAADVAGGLEIGQELSELPLEVGELALEDAPEALSTGLRSGAVDIGTEDNDGQIVLGVKEKYTLNVDVVGVYDKLTYKSSKKSVAKVSSKGVIEGVKKGTARITCYVDGAAEAVYEVKVVSAPSKVALSASTVKLGVDEAVPVSPVISNNSHAAFTWSVKDKKVATVSSEGVITGKKAGSTTVTVKTHNGKKASVTVKVYKKPSKVTLSETTAAMEVDEMRVLVARLPANTYSRITWTSSNRKVATVDEDGMVSALSVGTAKITAKTYNGKKATCTVRVRAEESNVTYRALLIGQVNFNDTCNRNRGDVRLMTNMLKSVRGPAGGSYSITQMYNLSASQTLDAIEDTFADADENDVSLFFIATHGDTDEYDDYAGALAMVPSGTLRLVELAEVLADVPGKVIVLLESCGSGAAVYPNGGASVSPNGGNQGVSDQEERLAKAFDAAVVEAFSRADPGVWVRANALDGDVRSNTGEFRLENKFYVLTASRFQESSWGMESYSNSCNYFTQWLCDGIGNSGHMPADTNNDSRTTLQELYKYISKVGDKYPFHSSGETYYQHVQVFPSNSSYQLFRR